jgi:hypothetical protein
MPCRLDCFSRGGFYGRDKWGDPVQQLGRLKDGDLFSFRSGPVLLPGTASRTLAIQNGDLIVGGNFRLVTPDGKTSLNIGRWDGKQWHHLGDGINQTVYTILATPLKIYVLSAGDIAQWDGNKGWQSIFHGSIVQIALQSNGELIAQSILPPSTASAINHWNGSTWAPFSDTELRGLCNSLGFLGNDLYAAGPFFLATQTWSLARLRGLEWSVPFPEAPIDKFWIRSDELYAGVRVEGGHQLSRVISNQLFPL